MLLRPAGMRWNDEVVSDHARSPINQTPTVIERKSRMANARLRKYVVATKWSWSCSWELLPDRNDNVLGMGTVDGGMGAADMEDFYNLHKGAFTLTLVNGSGDEEDFEVMFSDFSKDIAKRSHDNLWNVSVTLEQV